ncbi:hypothetical protein BCR43DRAFT_436279 [Syncephalastrum racemosum]|uniref:Uncharacterized protein n=1 Tax=Syncephalastrum racemosum TaxID=13706 RepID=A0A1X2HJM2_SYNRA|nr:hypothetical protein BCR43DRAFT_436279 [Syncephalastrum racemosum]
MEDFDFTDALDQQGFEPPAYHDRFVWEGIDVSAAFHRFQQAALETLDREEVLDYEKHAQHVLALSSILLLKSNRTHPGLLEFLDIRTCERLRAFMLERAGITSEDIVLPIKNRLQEILEKIADDPRVVSSTNSRPYPRFDASHDIMALIEGPGLNTFNRILRSVRNMVEMLPRYAIDDGPLETEYIIRYLGPLLSPLTFVSDTEREATKWLDSSALIIQDRPSGPRLGCGQVRLSHQAENQQFTGIDLIRLGQIAKKASDKDKALARFIFSVVGKVISPRVFKWAGRIITKCSGM